MSGMDRAERERFVRQAGAWRSLLAPYYVDPLEGEAHLSLTPEEAVATAEAVLAGRSGPRGEAREPTWSVLERRLAEAQQSMRGSAGAGI
jgi:hypothetical protein